MSAFREHNLDGEVGLEDEAITLSPATLAALMEFAREKGVKVERREEEGESEEAVDVVRAVQQHFDVKDKETIFRPSFGGVVLELMGLKRELGQTLDSTGLTIWRAADHLCEYMSDNREMFIDKDVCELGCGLGVVAILLNKFALGARILATDGDDKTLALLQKNMNNNSCDELLTAEKLLWSEDDEELEAFMQSKCGGRKFDIILAADVIYDETAVLPLAATCAALLKPQPGAYVLLGFARRNVPVGNFLSSVGAKGLKGTLVKSYGEFGNEAIYKLEWM
jgi:predicted nicotinamide N-methyase